MRDISNSSSVGREQGSARKSNVRKMLQDSNKRELTRLLSLTAYPKLPRMSRWVKEEIVLPLTHIVGSPPILGASPQPVKYQNHACFVMTLVQIHRRNAQVMARPRMPLKKQWRMPNDAVRVRVSWNGVMSKNLRTWFTNGWRGRKPPSRSPCWWPWSQEYN